jgi:hypothetical protein
MLYCRDTMHDFLTLADLTRVMLVCQLCAQHVNLAARLIFDVLFPLP